MPRYSINSNSQSPLPSSLEKQLYQILHPPILTDATQTEINSPDRSVRSFWLSNLWNAIIRAFEQDHEPIFWQKRDRNGNTYWECYDPTSGQTTYFDSETEARIWLDQVSYFR